MDIRLNRVSSFLENIVTAQWRNDVVSVIGYIIDGLIVIRVFEQIYLLNVGGAFFNQSDVIIHGSILFSLDNFYGPSLSFNVD